MKGIDWQNLLFRESLNQIHSLSLRGGSRTTKYSLSGSIFDQEGIIINTGSKRYQGRLSVDHEFNKRLRMSINVNYSENGRTGQIVNAGGASNYTAFALYRTWAYRPVSGGVDYDLLDGGYD